MPDAVAQHAQLLGVVEELREHCEGSEPLFALYSTARAVVELHHPEPCRYADIGRPCTHSVCAECGQAVNWPEACNTIRAVAEALGVDLNG